ncbi:MAG: glycerol-3-phosphate acyltransferase [Candidatus Heimdallarchaeota archaeon]|nr:glycerol-3-phosphate acyltransferase [Candidatus Heimdallarchaeota archaeon]
MSLPWIWAIICTISSYLIGSIPFSFLITKIRTGKDLRDVGTKNVGGLNTMITSGFGIGFLAGFLDFIKGTLCITIVMLIEFDSTYNNTLPLIYYQMDWDGIIYILVATAVVLGHNFSIFLKLKGGRGLATSAGTLVVINPLILLIYVVCLAILVAITKYARPSTFLAFFLALPAAFLLPIFPPWVVNQGLDSPFILGLIFVGLIIVTVPKYIQPVINLFQGKEYRVGREMKLNEKDELDADY